MNRLTSTWDRVFNKFRSKRSNKKRKGISPLKRRTFALEPLEERTLLSVNPLGDETLLNTYTVGTQQLYDNGDAVASMPDGGYVVSWTSNGQDGSGKGVYARRFDAEGTPASDEFLVNSTTDHGQQRSSVAVDAEGGFVVVWDSYGQDGILAGVFAQRYNSAGQAVGGEFQVNETSFGHQSSPAVACLDDGGFVVVWSGQGNGDSWGVFGRRYDADGQADGGEFLINSETGNLQRSSAVAALPDSGFVVAWQSHGGQDGNWTGVFAQRFDADCDPVGGEFQVNTTTDDHQSNPAIAADAAGRFTVVWQSRGQDSGGGYGVFAQRFNADGTTIDGEFQVNTYVSGSQKDPSIACSSDGGFVVSWSGKGPGDSHGVYVREFDADSVALGDEVLVNTTTSQWQQYATVANVGDEYVVVWSGKGSGDNKGVFLRRLGSPLSTSGIDDVSVAEDAADTMIDLSASFADANGSELTYQIIDNSDPSLFDSVSLDDDQLTLDYTADVSGSADITILATNSLGDFIESAFTVNIAPMNDAPTVLSFDAINVAEDAPQLTISLGDVFQDIDDWFYGLRFAIMSNSNPALFSSTDFNDSFDALILDLVPEVSGTANIVLRATDEEGLWAEATIPITVSAVNDAPVAAPATAVLARQDADPAVLDLATLFSDVDDPTANLSYEIIDNDNTSLVTAQLQGSQLTLSYAQGMTGSAMIVVRASDPVGHYDDNSYHTLNVTVSATNLAPQITGLLDAPDPAIEGATLHLTATGVIDDTAVSSIAYWRDADHDDTFDPAIDQLLGTDTDGSDGWQISVSSAGFGIGAQRYFAQATDEDSLTGNVATATGVVGVVAVLDNSAAGYAETGTDWTDNASGGYLNTARRHVAGSGENTAIWTFDGLMVKMHEVFITWKAESGLASNAQFTVYDGEQLLGTFSVDQRIAPNDANEEGVGWLKLGEYTITNGQLTVVLTDAADGVVIADAVRLVDPPPTIESLSVTASVTRLDDVTLTANNVADSDGTVEEVAFYRDTNGNSVYDEGTDELLGTDTSSAGGWSITADTLTFSTGTQTYFAIAEDNDTLYSDPAWVQGIVEGPAVYGPSSVYEGNTYTLQLDPTDIAITEWTIDWGDGSDDDVVAGSTRSLTHVYADGPNTWTIEVTGTDGVDTYYANQFDVDVLNVAPYLSISGDATVAEGSQYTLNLSVDDPGADTIDHWDIDWDDGNVEEITGNPSSVTHYYADGLGDYTITATADDGDGTDWPTGGVAGELDYSFGSGGGATTEFSTGVGTDYGRAMVKDANGKIIVAGYVKGAYDFQLVRYNTDGSLDTSFGDGGKVTWDVGGLDEIMAVGLQDDGKIVVAGFQGNPLNGTYDFAVARFHTDGTIDLSFGDGGSTITDFGSTDKGQSLAIQPDGKIVVGGLSYVGGGGYNFAIARYTADGRLDPTFDDDGKLTTNFNGGTDYIQAIAIQSDDKIVAAGFAYNGSNYDFALARYDEYGVLDTSFDGDSGTGDGKFTTPIGDGDDVAYAMAIEGDKIVLAGRSHNGSNNDIAVARYNKSDGELDTSFDDDGKYTLSIGSNTEEAYAVAVKSSGDILVSGRTLNGSNYDIFVACYDVSEDELDDAFGDDGIKTITYLAGYNEYAYAMLLDEANEQLFIAGSACTYLGYDFALAALDMDSGEYETGFSGDGKVTTDFSGDSSARDIVVQADGKIVASGRAYVDGKWDFILSRYNADGTLDTAFGTNGKQFTDFSSTNDYAYGMTLQPDQKIIVVGNAGGNFGVARYNTDGSPDMSFSDDGEIYQDIVGGLDWAWDVAVQNDDYIVVAGYANVSGSYDFALVRYDEDGVLDSDFDGDSGTGDGKVTTPIGAGTDYAYAMALQTIGEDEKILLAGTSHNGTDYDFALVRYNPDGTLDEDFDGDDVQNPGNGIITLDFGDGHDYIKDIVVLEDNRILVAGYARNGSYYDFALACYESDGTLDTDFGDDGVVLKQITSGYHSYGQSLEIQTDGKILLSGYRYYSGHYDMALARFTAEGDPDTSFGDEGKLFTDFGNSTDCSYCMALQPDDRIIVAGSAHNDYQLVRYLPGDVPTTVETTNVAPTLTVSNRTVVVDCETTLTDIGTFIDPGFDTETYSYTINWGDGSEPDTGSATIDVYGEDGVSTEGSFDGTHTYTSTDTYTVTVTLNDGDNQDVETFYVTVRDSAVYTWDGGGANDFWMNGDNWVGDVAPLPGDQLYFTSGSAEEAENDFPDETVFESIEFASAAFELSGNSITLTDEIAVNAGITGTEIYCDMALDGSIVIDMAYCATLTVYGDIYGDGSLTKTGEGTLILAGDNTYTGGTTVSEGTLLMGSDSALGVAMYYGLTIGSAGVLDLNNHDLTVSSLNGSGLITSSYTDDENLQLTVDAWYETCEYSGVIEDGLGWAWFGCGIELVKDGGDMLTLSGDNSYTGGTTISAGTLVIGEDATTLGGATVYGGTLQLAEGSEVDGDLTVDADGAVLFDGGTVTGDAMITGDVDLTVGKVSEVEGIIYLQGGLSESTTLGTGQTMVCGGLVIERDVTIDGGTLDLSGGALEVDPVIGNGLTLSGTLMNIGQIRAYGITPEYPLALYKLSEGTLTILGTNTYTEGSTVMAGTLVIGEDATTLGGATVYGGTLELATGSVVDGDLTVAVDGAVLFDGGTVTGDATITGDVDLTVGTESHVDGIIYLQGGLSESTTLGTGQTMVCGGLVIERDVTIDGGTLDLSGGALEVDPVIGNGLTLSGTLMNIGQIRAYGITPEYPLALYKLSEETLTILGTNTYTEGSTVMEGTLVIGENATTVGGAAVYGGTLQLAEGSEVDGDLTVAADGAVLFDGGTVTGDATITGDVDLTTGTVSHVDGIVYLQGGLSESTTLGTGQTMVCGGLVIERDVTIDGGTLDLSGGALEVDPVIGNGLTLSGTLMNIGQIRAYGITPEYPLALYKLGEGTLTVLGTNTYTEGSTVMASTLVIGENATTLGGATVYGGTLQLAEGSEVDGDLTVAADGAVLFDGGAVTGDIIDNGTVIFANTTDQTFTGVISGTGSVVKSGTGMLILDNTNTYTGGTVINTGVLKTLSPDALPNYEVENKLSVATGATIAVTVGDIDNWTSADIDDLLDNPSFSTGNLGLNVVEGETFIYSTAITGSIGLVKSGYGTLILTGNNTYTGGTTVEQGILIFGDPEIAPYVSVNGAISSDEGEVYSLELIASVAVEGWDINWGDNIEVSVPGAQSSSSHVYADGPDNLMIIAMATDYEDNTATIMMPITVENVAPTLNVVANQIANPGQMLSLTDLGTFSDPGYSGYETFAYTIDWGDGSAFDTGTATVDVAGSPGYATEGSFDGSHIYCNQGIHTVTVTLTDDDGGADTKTFLVRMNVAPTVQTQASASLNADDTAVSLSALGEDDADESHLTYTWTVISKPEGATDPYFTVNNSNLAKATVAYFDRVGSYEFAVTITDANGLWTTSNVQVYVNQNITGIIVSAESTTELNAGDTQQFHAVTVDQYGQDMATQPTFSWNSDRNRIDYSTGLYTAPTNESFIDEITVYGGGKIGHIAVSVVNERPSVDVEAAAELGIEGTSATLTVLGDDDADESSLIYHWDVTLLSEEASAPSISVNDTNGAKSTEVTFESAGLYRFTVTISDDEGLTTTNVVRLAVEQSLSSIVVTPNDSQSLNAGETIQFEAVAYDQFESTLLSQPDFTWNVTPAPSAEAGTITDTGYYTAPNTSASDTVTAENGAVVSNEVGITVTNSVPTVSIPATLELNPDGLTAELYVYGDDDAGESNLSYSWTAISWPVGTTEPTFSVNDSYEAAFTTVTFSAVGDYQFSVRITDEGDLFVDSPLSYTLNQMLTSISISPTTPSVNVGGLLELSATGYDQYEDEMTTQPTFNWSTTAGTIDTDGDFTPPNTSVPVIVTAESDGISAETAVLVSSTSPTTTARLGDSWIQTLWEQSLGSPGAMQRAYINQATGNVVVTVDGGNFTVDPEDAFVPYSLQNIDSSDGAGPTYTEYDWYVGDDYYVAGETVSWSLDIDEVYDSLTGEWTYDETYSLTYSIVTTLNSNSWSSASGSYSYTFDAEGDDDGSNYVSVASTTADSSVSGEWSQTVSCSDTTTNDTDTTSSIGSSSGSGGATWSFSYTTPYSSDPVSGTTSESGGGSVSYGYSVDHAWTSGSGWSASGTAWNRSSGSDHYSYSGSGTYVDDDYEETVQEDGNDHSYYDYTTNYSLPAGSDWQFTSGSGGTSGSGESNNSYSGSGTYSYSGDGETMSGSFEESGEDHYSYDYTTTASCSASGWSETGDLTEYEDGESHYSYSGTGTYTDSGEGWSSSGTTSESGEDNDSYDYTTDYELDEYGFWLPASGSGDASGSGFADTSYSGSGVYSSSGDGQTMSGTFEESGEHNSTYEFTTDAVCLSGLWAETGDRAEYEEGLSYYSYSGSGTYEDSGDGWSSSGTLSESGVDLDSYDYTTNYELDEDVFWQASSGSGGSLSSGETHWSYSGDGEYSYLADGGTIEGTFEESGQDNTSYLFSTTATCTDGEWSESGSGSESENGGGHYSFSGSGDAERSWNGWSSSGTISEIGGDDDSYNYTTNYVLDEDGYWETTSGSGGSSGSGSNIFTFFGGGEYSASSYCGGLIDGTFTQNESDGDSYDYNTTATLSSGTWSESGTGSYTEDGSKNYGFSGSGSYSRSPYIETWNGTLDEVGSAAESYGYTTQYDIDEEGNWLASSGSGGSSGSGSTHSSYSGSCSGWSEGSLDGSAQESGFDDTSYEFETEAAFDPTWGDWTETGSKTASGSGGSSQSYSGSGDLSVWQHVWLSGSTYGNGNEETSYSFIKDFELDDLGQWQMTSGSANAAGNGETHSSGSASASASLASRIGTQTVPGVIDYTESDDSFYNYSQDYLLSPDDNWLAGSGSGEASGSGACDTSYSGSGSYSGSALLLPTSGNALVSGEDYASYQYQTAATSVHGLWSETGSASATDSGSTSASYSGSGEYTRNLWIYAGLVDGSISGTIQENGDYSTSYNYTKSSELKPDGNWTSPVGYGSSTVDSSDHWSYSGSGDYTTVDVPGNTYWIDGTVEESGSEDREAHFTIESATGLNGMWYRSGTGTEAGSHQYNVSYDGSYSWDEDSSVDGYVRQGTNTAATTINATIYAYGTNYESGYFDSTGDYTKTWALDNYSGWKTTLFEESEESECYADFTRDATSDTIGDSGTWSSHGVNHINNQSLTESVIQTISRPNAYGYMNRFAGYESETTTSSGLTTEHYWSSFGTGSQRDRVDAFGLGEDGCVQQTTTIYYDDFSWSNSSSCVNYVSGHWFSYPYNQQYNYSYGEPNPILITSPGYYMQRGVARYSPLMNYEGIMFNGFPTSASPPNIDFLYYSPGGTQPFVSMLGSDLTTMQSEATWMTTDYARSPTEFGLLAPTTAANMSTGNTNTTTKMPWSAPTHNSTPRAESIPLRNPPEETMEQTMMLLSMMAGMETSGEESADYSYTFDNGRVVAITDPNEGVTSFTYDAAGNLTSLTDPEDNTTTWVYDANRRMIEEIDPLGESRYYDYNPIGDLIRYTDRNGLVRVYEYDSERHLTSETWYADATDADARQNALNTITFVYDSYGNLLSESDDYSSYAYAYDSWGQLSTVTFVGIDGPTVVFSSEYDDYGQRTSLSTAIDESLDFVNDYVYDDYGRIVSLAQHGATGGNAVAEKQLNYSYNEAWLLESIDRSLGSQLTVQSDFAYDSFGRLTGMTHHLGETPLSNYSYAYSNEPSFGQTTVVAGQNDSSLSYLLSPLASLPVYDTQSIVSALMIAAYSGSVADYLTAVQSIDGWVNYSYDSTGQLVAADYSGEGTLPDDESYAWDLNGNQNGEDCVVGVDNRLLSDGTYWYEYDAEGNRTARFVWTDTDNDQEIDPGERSDITEYAWDARNRLVKVTDYATEGGLPTQAVDYLYDTEDRWIGKLLDSDGDGEIDHQTRFVYNDGQIALQFDKDGEDDMTVGDLSHRYLWRPDVIDQLMADEQLSPLPPGEGQGEGSAGYDLTVPGDVLWALTDHLGTVRDLAVHDAQTGVTSIANHRVYDSFGNLASQTNSAVDSLFGYTGRAYDTSTNLQDNWHRKYTADTTTWLNKDPITFTAGDINTSRYVGNSPTMLVDPVGLWEQVAGSENLWKATSEADTFYSLVSLVDANLAPSKSAMCIRPTTNGLDQKTVDAMRDKWGKVNQRGNVPKPAVDGIYDVSSLLQKRDPEAAPVAVGIGLDGNGYIVAAEAFFNARHFDTGAALAEFLRTTSNFGTTPIGTLILVGHGNKGANAIGSQPGSIGQRPLFKLGDLTNVAKNAIDRKITIYDKENQLAYWPTFDEAIAGQLPPVAWLTTDAIVYVVGCYTNKFAGTIATKWLRSNQAEAWGTLRATWATSNGMGWATPNGRFLERTIALSATPEEYFKEKQTQTVTITKKELMDRPNGGKRWGKVTRTFTREVDVWHINPGIKR